jgi:hypothetical protein
VPIGHGDPLPPASPPNDLLDGRAMISNRRRGRQHNLATRAAVVFTRDDRSLPSVQTSPSNITPNSAAVVRSRSSPQLVSSRRASGFWLRERDRQAPNGGPPQRAEVQRSTVMYCSSQPAALTKPLASHVNRGDGPVQSMSARKESAHDPAWDFSQGAMQSRSFRGPRGHCAAATSEQTFWQLGNGVGGLAAADEPRKSMWSPSTIECHDPASGSASVVRPAAHE